MQEESRKPHRPAKGSRRAVWSKPPNRRFPRQHLWTWEASINNEEEEFEKVTSMVLADSSAATEEGRKKAAAALSALVQEEKTMLAEGTTNANGENPGGADSRRKTIEAVLMSKMKAKKTKYRRKSGKFVLSQDDEGEKRTRRFSLNAQDLERGIPGDNRNLKSECLQEGKSELDKNDFDIFQTPTPPPILFGAEDYDAEDPSPELQNLLIEQQKSSEKAESSLDIFLKECFKGQIVPEPLLASRRQEAKETMEASKMYENLDVQLKSDLAKNNDRNVPPLTWELVSKMRSPDELKLNYYGLGDQYMGAIAAGLKIDASHGIAGKRCFQRFNLRSCRMTGRGLQAFMEGFKVHPRALKLDLADNQLGPAGISPLTHTFQENCKSSQSLLVLDLSGNQIGDRAIQELFTSLRDSKVEWLNLSKNQIGSAGAQAIAKFIREQKRRIIGSPSFSLKSHNSFIASPQALHGLGSTQANLGGDIKRANEDEDAENSHYSSLQTLLLDWNHIRGVDAANLILSFKENLVISELSLSWNGFGNHPDSTEAVYQLIEESTALKVLRLGHNLFSSESCQSILKKSLVSRSLLSIDLTGNQPHPDIFSNSKSLLKLQEISECWPFEQNDLTGNNFIYTRYLANDQAGAQQKLIADEEQSFKSKSDGRNKRLSTASFKSYLPPFVANQVSTEENEAQNGDIVEEKSSEMDPSKMECLDAYLWKKRSVCWIENRWTKQTIWYYPGISGPPSNDIFLELLLPNGAAMCMKMKSAHHLQKSYDGEGKKRKPSTKSSSLSTSTTSNASGPRGATLQKSFKQTRLGAGRQSIAMIQKKQTQREKIGVLNKAIPEKNGEAEHLATMQTINARKRRLHRMANRKPGSPLSYDYSKLLYSAGRDKSTMLGRAILDSIRNQAEEAEDCESDVISNLKDLSLTHEETICPYFATIMLPPGRTQYKFVVRGEEIFAKDQDTCWTSWPTELRKDSESNTLDVPKSATEVQQRPCVANCIDLKWQSVPVENMANPDPGPERPSQPMPWTIRKSIFRYHQCDTAKTLKDVFQIDWEKAESNSGLRKVAGEEIESVRELVWAHFSDLCTLFSILSCGGENSFALSFSDLLHWIREKEIVPETVPEDFLYEVYDQTALVEMRMATNPFGKHYSFMVKTQFDGEVKTDCSMVRHQFIQFLIVVAVKVYAPAAVSRPSVARSQGRRASLSPSLKPTAEPGLELKGKSKFGTEAFDSPFEALHHMLQMIFLGHEHEYIHRDVFRRGQMFFQDVVNVFLRNFDFLKEFFDKYAVKGHVLHDFIPIQVWDTIFSTLESEFPKASMHKIFALSKSTSIDFDDIDFAPGLCFLEFLECLARLARLKILAEKVVSAFDRKTNALSRLNKEIHALQDDGLAFSLEFVISLLKKLYDEAR